MYLYRPVTPGKRIIRLVISIFLIIAVAAAAFPQTAQAGYCQKYYTVQKGDKTGTIARTYGVKWIEIAAANDLVRPYKLNVGDQLCIPFKYSVSLKNTLAASNVNSLIAITASGFENSGNYYVKVRDITSGPGEWYKIGKLKVRRNDTVTGKYQLPKQLNSSIFFEVCLKNGTSNEVVCRNVRHIFK